MGLPLLALGGKVSSISRCFSSRESGALALPPLTPPPLPPHPLLPFSWWLADVRVPVLTGFTQHLLSCRQSLTCYLQSRNRSLEAVSPQVWYQIPEAQSGSMALQWLILLVAGWTGPLAWERFPARDLKGLGRSKSTSPY